MSPAVTTATVRRRILLLLLLGVDRPNDFVLPPVVEAFEVVLPGRVADGAVVLSLRFLQGWELNAYIEGLGEQAGSEEREQS